MAAEAIVVATDYTGIALLVGAIGTVIVPSITAYFSWRSSKTSERTEKAVDGKMTEMVELVAAKSSAEGQLQEQEQRRGREQGAPESPKIAAAQAIIDRDQLKEVVAAAVKEALAGMQTFVPVPVVGAPTIAPSVTIEKVVAENIEAKTVTTDKLVTAERRKEAP